MAVTVGDLTPTEVSKRARDDTERHGSDAEGGGGSGTRRKSRAFPINTQGDRQRLLVTNQSRVHPQSGRQGSKSLFE